MTRTVTYGQLDRLLSTLGFVVAPSKETYKVYDHVQSETLIVLTRRDHTTFVCDADLVSIRQHLVDNGFLEDNIFNAFISKGTTPVGN